MFESEDRNMAEPLSRFDDDDFDSLPIGGRPNLNVVPPPAPLGSADEFTSAAARRHEETRGEALMHGDEVDVANRPRHLLEPYSEAKERSWPLGEIPSQVNQAFNRAGSRLRSFSSVVSQGTFSRERFRDYAEEWKDRFADLVDDLQHSATRFSRDLRANSGEWKVRAQDRAQLVRRRTEDFIDSNPTQAIAIAAGAGLVLGVLLRLGKAGRDYEY
jgi:ElaB/YqjD/DUF883 family membrane-anchored ribosome-binding protein